MKGSELDKQIYKEGEPTWGCKSGWLDVVDVITYLKERRKEWRAKMKRMEVISVDVAILESELLDEKIFGEELVE